MPRAQDTARRVRIGVADQRVGPVVAGQENSGHAVHAEGRCSAAICGMLIRIRACALVQAVQHPLLLLVDFRSLCAITEIDTGHPGPGQEKWF